jgi:hypothetical protein
MDVYGETVPIGTIVQNAANTVTDRSGSSNNTTL